MDEMNLTLGEAREIILARARDHKKGPLPKCPCCDGVAKVYKRHITSAMAEVLVHIYRYFEQHPEENWVNVPKLLKAHRRQFSGVGEWGGDFAKLRFWGLIKPRPSKRNDGSNRTGWWAITELGREFVKRGVNVREFVWIYNDRDLERECPTLIWIDGVKNFNYDEMIKGV